LSINTRKSRRRGGRAPFTVDPLAVFRKRLLEQTELAILIGLTFPDRVPSIPRIEVGKGGFDPQYAIRFWAETLGLEPERLQELDASLANLHGYLNEP